jgi:hypothetical protein
MAQEAAWELVESAWVVMVDPALVRFCVMSSEVETSLASIFVDRRHNNQEIPRLRSE